MRLALLLLLSLTTAFGAEKKYTLRDFNLGKYVSGARVTPALQKDKGTVIVFWVYELQVQRGGEGLKPFQTIAEAHKEDLVVVGVEDAGVAGNAKTIGTLLKKAGVTYSTYIGCQKPMKNNLYPFVCVFDREGKMVYGGNPTEEDLKGALEQATAKPEKKDGKDEPKKDEKEKPKVDPKKAA